MAIQPVGDTFQYAETGGILGGPSTRTLVAQGVLAIPPTIAWTQTTVVLAAASSATLIAANPARRGLVFENIGANPATYLVGAGPAIVGAGRVLASAAFVDFSRVTTQAFTAISTVGTTIIVWEGV